MTKNVFPQKKERKKEKSLPVLLHDCVVHKQPKGKNEKVNQKNKIKATLFEKSGQLTECKQGRNQIKQIMNPNREKDSTTAKGASVHLDHKQSSAFSVLKICSDTNHRGQH